MTTNPYADRPVDEEHDVDESDSEDRTDVFYVVGYNVADNDAKVMGPLFMQEEAGSANYFLNEFYSRSYYDKVMVFMVRDNVKVRKHEVMLWERDWERLGFEDGQIFAERDEAQDRLIKNTQFHWA
jgi:hypothetical protein